MADLDFTDKVAVVTGAGSGIGAATAEALAQRGAQLALLDRDVSQAQAMAGRICSAGGVAQAWGVDVSEQAQVESAIAEIVEHFAGIDVLVNAAGVQRYGTVLDVPIEIWEETLRVNLGGVFLMCRHVVPHLIARGGGSIVNVGSVQSVGAVVNSVAYVTSKHAVLGLTRAIALDHARHNIRVHCVCPGAIDTPMLRRAAEASTDPALVLESCASVHALERLGQAEEVANVILFLASPLSSFMTGNPVLVEGGMMAPIGGMAFQRSGTGALVRK
jgi:NAD(P)-dependent dehydrogenase (short-subunit alcohol dehydrogenase family)